MTERVKVTRKEAIDHKRDLINKFIERLTVIPLRTPSWLGILQVFQNAIESLQSLQALNRAGYGSNKKFQANQAEQRAIYHIIDNAPSVGRTREKSYGRSRGISGQLQAQACRNKPA